VLNIAGYGVIVRGIFSGQQVCYLLVFTPVLIYLRNFLAHSPTILIDAPASLLDSPDILVAGVPSLGLIVCKRR
jgi:hypothetical protein